MCSVCGCGEPRIEGEQQGEHHVHSDHHRDHHHHGHDTAQDRGNEQRTGSDYGAGQTVVIHHYHHQGDVHHHHHHHYHGAAQENSTAVEKQAGHSHELAPEHSVQGDLHYGKGEAGTHVPGLNQRQLIQIEMDVLGKNDQLAEHNREHFSAARQLVLNLVSSPGSGKTTLLAETLKQLRQRRACAVIEGDQQTTHDADRIRATGVPAIQVNTGKGCHLDAKMVHDAYHQLSLDNEGILFIENVGNLVCPSSFDLGENYKVAILSVTEGEDKPLKYPNMFAASPLMIINKIDLLPYVSFDIDNCIANARRVNPDIQVIPLSATTGEGMSAWFNWLETA
ncbi:hydrogenase nickel incorporation protein HypB [Photobacterium sp.]|uniref:hydrogenase nickel incorporation protein HypB n=1 Tax=Photobacterium sp. TaxID=660 RepID=UPI00299ED2E9|nr:hydrogenase nickel incorporation protein HypB [Photobacterium sp.]MDX1303316.1 hydrogenase nickel incorporation protein HypB [Photobacterium sp.]